MDIDKSWNKALKETEIIRTRIQGLLTNSDTAVSYILLSESSVNIGDTVIRRGEIMVTKPSIIIPPNNPLFLGFEFDSDSTFKENSFVNFLLVRGITVPSLQYNNKTSSLDIYEGSLSQAIKYYNNVLQKGENINTGLIVGPEECWQFSLIIFICSQIARNADADIKKLLDDYKKQNGV